MTHIILARLACFLSSNISPRRFAQLNKKNTFEQEIYINEANDVMQLQAIQGVSCRYKDISRSNKNN
jgi:hypothetical protein